MLTASNMSEECSSDQNESNGKDTQKSHLKLYHLVMLACFIIGAEGTTVFGQIYSLLTLEYLGVPTSLATANGFVGGCSAVFLIPMCGLLMDKGDNPKSRKLVAMGLSALIFIGGFAFLLVAALFKITEGKKSNDKVEDDGENAYDRPQNVSSLKSSNIFINKTYDGVQPFSDTLPAPTDDTPWIPITGILGLVAFSLLDLAFDLGNFFSRAFALDHTPPTQHKLILMMVSLLAPGAGAVVSLFGILDLPGFLGGAFNVDGTAATLMFFATFLTTVVISDTLCTTLTGLWVARTKGFLLERPHQQSPTNGLQMSSGLRKESCGTELTTSSPVGEETSCIHCPSAYRITLESSAESCSNGNGRMNVSFNEKVPLLVDAKRPKKIHESLSSQKKDMCKMHKTSTFTSTVASDVKDSKDCNAESNKFQGKEPHFFSKKLVILIMATYASMFSMVHFSMFSSNALTIGVYHGDPLASVGTEGKDRYTEGLRKSALGSTIFYASYFITSATNGKLVPLVGERVIFFVSHLLHPLITLAFVYLQRVELFYASMATFGPFRWALFTIPYMMANEFTNSTMGSNTVDQKRGLSKAGRVVSIISVIGPINYLTSSGAMGPLLAVTGNVWLPLILSFSGGFLSAFIFIPLFFMK